MKITKGKKMAIISFCIFLGFMAVCTVVAKGIYRSRLPQVTTQRPYGSSLTHVLESTGTVRQGQEYGFFVESGLKVSIIAVRSGDVIEPGQNLFRIDTEDLQELIDERQLALEKLKNQRQGAQQGSAFIKQEQQVRITRAKEDYEQVLTEADALIIRREQDLEEAEWKLSLYDQYLWNLSNEWSQDVSGGNVEPDASQQYSQQSQRYQLLQAVVDATYALEDAKRQKEKNLQNATRAIEDAERGSPSNTSGTDNDALDIAYQEKRLEELKELLQTDGWITAKTPGRVLEVRLSIGSRTQDGASILYAQDDGSRIIEASFSLEAGPYMNEGTEVDLQAKLSDAPMLREKVSVTYVEKTQEEVKVWIETDNKDLKIGQNVDLSLRAQTENFITCVPFSCLQQDGPTWYVYVAEEKEGILGTEWTVRRVQVSIMDSTDTVAAISSVQITTQTRIVTSFTGNLTDGAVVRLVG